jgi:uncharacterized membrane protein YvlD (DUF360 family)
MTQSINLNIILTIVILHFISDFLFQNDKMALNKSKSWKWLGIHSVVYTVLFIFINPLYALINGICHFIIDAITSRITSYLWQKEERHWFFVVIGFDQMLHMSTLFLTLILLKEYI